MFPFRVNSGTSGMDGSGGITVLILLDSVIGNVDTLPFRVNSGTSGMDGSGGTTELKLLDNDMGSDVMFPFNKIVVCTDLPVSVSPEN